MYFVVLGILLASISSAQAFDDGSYKSEEIERYSLDKVSKVKNDRRKGGVPESLGFSFNTAAGQKIKVLAEVKNCKALGPALKAFLDSGTQMSALNPQLKAISQRECSLKIKNQVYDVIAQTEVADFANAAVKAKKASGRAYLLYLGVSNEKAVYLLNKFEPEENRIL